MKKILIRLFYDKSQRLFCKFINTKQTVSRERRHDDLQFYSVLAISISSLALSVSVLIRVLSQLR